MSDVILIPTVGAPEFLVHQIPLIRRHCAETVEICVVNDAKPVADPTNWWQADAREKISDVCATNGVTEIAFPQERHRRRADPSLRTGEAIQFGYDSLVGRASRIAVIDSDMFPIVGFSFDRLLADFQFAGISQKRSHKYLAWREVFYLWNGLLFINVERLKAPRRLDFASGSVRGVATDTGGKLYYYLRRLRTCDVRNLQHLSSGRWNEADFGALPPSLLEFARSDPANTDGKFFSELYTDRFFHFRSGGNWQSLGPEVSPVYAERQKMFVDALAELTRNGS